LRPDEPVLIILPLIQKFSDDHLNLALFACRHIFFQEIKDLGAFALGTNYFDRFFFISHVIVPHEIV
jgi:hypothetical protein